MPSGPRIRSNSEFGLITDNPLTAGATSFNSARLSLFPVVSSAHAVVTLDPRAINGEPEIVVITAHTAAATVATIVRGQYGTAARAHPVGTEWIHAPVDEDFVEILTSSTRPTDPYRGQMIFETDTNRFVGRTTADTWLNTNMLADPPSVHLHKSVAEATVSNIGEQLIWDTEVFDNDNMWTVGSPALITINTAGWYLLTLNLAFAARNDYEVAWGAIRLNGSSYLALNNSRASIVGASDLHIVTSCTRRFTAGQVLTTEGFQRNTAAAGVNILTTVHYSPVFTAVWIGR